MAIETLEIKISKSFGGHSNRFEWSNVHHLLPVGRYASDATVIAFAEAIMQAERMIHLDNVHFNKIHIRPTGPNLTAAEKKHFKTIRISEVGLRESATSPMPIEIALEVIREATFGRPGIQIYRGCLRRADVVESDDNSFVLADPDTFDNGTDAGITFIEQMNTINLPDTLVIPASKNDADRNPRRVYRFALGGVGIVNYTRDRSSVLDAQIKAAQREANDLGKQARNLLADFVGDVTNGDFLSMAFDLLRAYVALRNALPSNKRAKLKMPSALKALPALPA